MSPKTIFAREVDGVRVAVHTAEDPCDDDWKLALEWSRTKAREPAMIRYLVLSEGGKPNARQRAEFSKVVGDHSIRTALVTGSVLARGAITAMSWFNADMRAFAPDNLDEAFAFLGIPSSQHDRFRSAIAELRAEMRLSAALA
jgi:hypothetical protein